MNIDDRTLLYWLSVYHFKTPTSAQFLAYLDSQVGVLS
jgi:hypothetical protein